MRRLVAVVLPALVLTAGMGVGSTPASAQVDHDARRRGLLYEGLQRVDPADLCRGKFRIEVASESAGRPRCTHGPDPAPEGVDVTNAPPAAETAPSGGPGTAAATTVPCFGNGSDGHRVQLIYARSADVPDAYQTLLPQMQQWARRIDDVFNLSAGQTGGTRHVRFVHDADCVPVIHNVVLSERADNDISNTIDELVDRGYTASNRKYLIWMDANEYCGIAEIYDDDSASSDNLNNGPSWVPAMFGRVDRACWGLTNMVEVHELVHMLGGVQDTAPHATPFNHCTDNYDRLCYDDGTGRTVTVVCTDPGQENRLDCNKDDYFSTAPAVGSYLYTHWNVARSRFLDSGGGAPPTTSTTAPPPSTTRPMPTWPWWATTTTRPTSTTTTRPATTTTTTTTTRPPSTTGPTTTTPTTVAPPTTTTPTTVPPSQVPPSAPTNALALQPAGGAPGIVLSWGPPASVGNPPFTTYRIYRGLLSWNLAPVAEVGSSTLAYHDTATQPGTVYWYAVTAVNAAGESPKSNLARMVAR